MEGGASMTLPLPADRHFLAVSDLLSAGFSYYKINKLVAEGKLIKLNNKMYENTAYSGEVSDFSVVSAYAPKGILCMMTAVRYYALTTYLPDSVDIAIERNMKISTMPEWPSINIWYFPEKRYNTGIVRIADAAGEYRIYDIEKTVIDILYYRNKVGIEETKEVLRNYLAKPDRDLIRLRRYADTLGCKKILGTYLEVLL
jgi:predicted transcriptional regulator of viral defense system